MTATIYNDRKKVTRFGRFHPLVPFLFYTGSISLFILMLQPVFLACGFFVLLIIHLTLDRFSGLRYWLLFMITSGFLFFLLNPLFNMRGRHLLFMIGNHRITLEALVYGGMNGLSVMGIIAIFVSYNEVMTPNKLLFLFSKFMPQFAILLMLTLRFIPLMRRRLAEISLVQNSKGFSLSHGKWKDKVKIGMQYIQVLVSYSLEEAIQVADSMKARGYGGRKRTSYEHFIIKSRDIVAITYLVLLYCLILYGRIQGHGFLQIYPIMGTWHLGNFDMILLCFYLLFLCFPILIEIGGRVYWRLLS